MAKPPKPPTRHRVPIALSGHMLERWSPEEVMIDGQAVPPQQAMIDGQLGYWDRPEAMWLILGLYALAGCIVGYFLRHWLTKGTEFKI